MKTKPPSKIKLFVSVLVLALLAKETYDNMILRKSVAGLTSRVEALEKQTPGLGDYMTTLQLHMGKLWFAGKASNWDLANYELDELKETMEGAQGLHSTVNHVDISNVLGSVIDSQVGALKQAIGKHDFIEFKKTYSQTMTACNSCHRSAAHGFNVITFPTAPPVSNQLWTPLN